MNILFLSTKSPYPPKEGHTLRTYNLLKIACENNNIYFLTFLLEDEEVANFKQMDHICYFAKGFRLKINESKLSFIKVLFRNFFSRLPFICEKYKTSEMENEIKKILLNEKIDLIHVDMLPLMCYFDTVKKYPLILVNHNVESLLLKRRVRHTKNVFEKAFLGTQYFKLKSYETDILKKVDICVAVSENDGRIFNEMQPYARISVVPNGVDTDYFFPATPTEEVHEQLVFVGGLNWFPNLDGITFFCEQILPKVHVRIPSIETTIIGKVNRDFKYSKLINQVGYVDDIRPYVHMSKVYIVPLRVGGGTRLKILDAMAMGKAIVTTSIGCEGLDVRDGIHLLIRDDPQEFAAAIIELLVNEKQRINFGINARKLVEEKYKWDILGKQMDAIYNSFKR